MTKYKIRNEDGLFSKGGMNPTFDKKGKLWSSIGMMKSHFNLFTCDALRKHYKNCSIVRIEIIEYEKDDYPIDDIIEENILQREIKAIEQEEYYAKERKIGLENQMVKIKNELSNYNKGVNNGN